MSNNGFGHEIYYRPYGVDQGNGIRMVQYKAWRIDQPHVFGYGMTLEDAIDDLVKNVAPSNDIRRSAFISIGNTSGKMDYVRTTTNLTPLKYCIRLKHSLDMPLKRPRKNCVFKAGDECTWHPATHSYCRENGINVDLSTRFRCVLSEA